VILIFATFLWFGIHTSIIVFDGLNDELEITDTAVLPSYYKDEIGV